MSHSVCQYIIYNNTEKPPYNGHPTGRKYPLQQKLTTVPYNLYPVCIPTTLHRKLLHIGKIRWQFGTERFRYKEVLLFR